VSIVTVLPCTKVVFDMPVIFLRSMQNLVDLSCAGDEIRVFDFRTKKSFVTEIVMQPEPQDDNVTRPLHQQCEYNLSLPCPKVEEERIEAARILHTGSNLRRGREKKIRKHTVYQPP
jgi:hypothetical protein